ncbi:MAG: S53 family peptidase, partial [Thermoplasmata archaeon]
MLDRENFISIPVTRGTVQKTPASPYNGTISVFLTFSFSNQSRLNSMLSNLSNPNSAEYHKFMTRSQFAENFSVSSQIYSQAVSYLSQYPGIRVKTYADRISIQVTGSATNIGKLFNTTIESNGTSKYFAGFTPQLPDSLAPYVSDVTGLSNAPSHVTYNIVGKEVVTPKVSNESLYDGYPTPVSSGGIQDIYGSDLQVAYDEQTLLNITYPTNEVIATILWAGTNSSGNPVGPFDPSDIYAYYNSTIPSYEPHAKVFGVPLNGAAKPGVSASYDTTGANQENTLDLEMAGSTAPGASIYNVYGPNSTYESLDAAFAFILNPNSSYPALNNVSVITNSWGGPESNNTVWYQYLQEAQVRGITVLASSGDSGDNNRSSKYMPNPNYPGDYVQFPAAMA